MHILLLTQVLPYPPDSGPKIKTWNLIKYLSQRHEVTLVSFVRGDQSAEADALRRVCKAVYTVPIQRQIWRDGTALMRSLLSGQPWTMVRDARQEMFALVERLTREEHFDIIHADQLNMAQYAARGNGAPRILDAHNALWVLYKRLADTLPVRNPLKWLYARDWKLLKHYEGEICRVFDGVLAVSREDAAALQEAGGAATPLQIVPIAIDADEMLPVKRRPDADHILHIGTMFWPPNVDGMLWFLENVFPLVRARRPEVQCDILGSRPPAEILAWDGKNVNVTGYVEDPAPYLERAGVMIVPLRAGGGMRVKILNALSQELPLVSTTIGAEGIALEDGVHALIADTPEDFAAAVLRLLEDHTLAAELGRNGRRLILEKYDYRRACAPVDDLYRKAVEGRRRTVDGRRWTTDNRRQPTSSPHHPLISPSHHPITSPPPHLPISSPPHLPPPPMSRQTLWNIIKVLVSLGLIAYLFIFQVDLGELAVTFGSVRWPYVVAAALVMIFGTALRGLRWQVLLEALDMHVPLSTLIHLYFVGAFFNMFLPSGFGGDAVKMAKLTQETGQAPESIGTTLVERATGLWVLFLMALVALPFSRGLLPPAWIAPILVLTLGGVAGGFLLMGTPLLPWLGGKIHLPGQDKLERFYRSVAQLGYPALLKACGVSLVFDLLLILFTWLLAESVDVHQPLLIYLLFTPIISFSLALPISIGGLGVREQTFVTLFAAVGVSAAAATAMSLLNYVITYLVVGLIGGLFFMAEGMVKGE